MLRGATRGVVRAAPAAAQVRACCSNIYMLMVHPLQMIDVDDEPSVVPMAARADDGNLVCSRAHVHLCVAHARARGIAAAMTISAAHARTMMGAAPGDGRSGPRVS